MFDSITKIFTLEPDYYKLPTPLFDDNLNIGKIGDTIGFFGPLILLPITILKLLHRFPYLIGYLVGFFVNTTINRYIKSTVKEPRPDGGRSVFTWEHYTGAEKYGMPSLHAQSVIYSTAFLYFTTGSQSWLVLNLFIAALTLYQRWYYKRHTIQQLIIGSGLGVIIAWISWKMTFLYLRTQV